MTMTPVRPQLFEAILERPRAWRRLAFGAFAIFALYLALVLAIVAAAMHAEPKPRKPRRELVVTLFDAPKLADARSLSLAGGARGSRAGGDESSGRLPKIADPRFLRAAPKAAPKLRPEPKALASDPPHESQRAGTDPLPVTPRSAEHEGASSPTSVAVASSTTRVGSRELGTAGPATTGGSGAGQGEGAGQGGRASGAGAGVRAGALSGATRVLPFMDGMTRPELLSKVDPQYTREARDANVEGLILAKCVIGTTGTLSACRIMKGLPLMDQAVLAALPRWRYSPVLYQGRPVAVEYLIPVRLVAP